MNLGSRSLLAGLALALAGLAPALAAPTVPAPRVAEHPASVAPRDGTDPRLTRDLFVRRTLAARAGAAFREIAREPQALWLTGGPEPTRHTREYVRRAEAADRTPMLVVYNIPGRDCGQFSAQPSPVSGAQYRAYVRAVAAGLTDSHPLVVLEPDALSFVGDPSCGGQGARLALLRDAVRVLGAAGAWVYVDAGNSGWQPPGRMARLLQRVDVAGARGFATNVAHTRAKVDELAYARAIAARLARRGISGVHAVIDVGRSGAGRAGPDPRDYCNPVAARLGEPPRTVFSGVVDALLWIKPPGESDGYCNGGPAAGEFFPSGACRLMGQSWAYYDDYRRVCVG